MASESKNPSGSNDQPDDYDRDRTHKEITGMGAFLEQIASDSSIQQDGDTSAAKTDEQYLQKVCDLSYGGPRHIKTNRLAVGDIYCDVCQIHCNSEQMYEAHINGKNHQKKLNNLKNLQQARIASGVGPLPVSQEINGPPSAKKKKREFFDLRSKLKDAIEPTLALNYIEELIPETNPTDFEVNYICNLCVVTSPGMNMYTHIIGIKHRNKYMEMLYGYNIADKIDSLEYAKEVERNEGRDVDRIRTVMSDARYPWPPGKAPWATDSGGNGPPTTSQFNTAQDKPVVTEYRPNQAVDYGHGSAPKPIPTTPMGAALCDQNLEPRARAQLSANTWNSKNESTGLKESPVSGLLSNIAKCVVKNEHDATMAHDVASSLIKALVKYKSKTIDTKYATALFSACDNLLDSLSSIYKMPSTVPMRPVAPPPVHSQPPTAAPQNETRERSMDRSHSREPSTGRQPSDNGHYPRGPNEPGYYTSGNTNPGDDFSSHEAAPYPGRDERTGWGRGTQESDRWGQRGDGWQEDQRHRHERGDRRQDYRRPDWSYNDRPLQNPTYERGSNRFQRDNRYHR